MSAAILARTQQAPNILSTGGIISPQGGAGFLAPPSVSAPPFFGSGPRQPVLFSFYLRLKTRECYFFS